MIITPVAATLTPTYEDIGKYRTWLDGRARPLVGMSRQKWFGLAMSDFGTAGTINQELPLLAVAYRVLEISGCAAKKMPAPITVVRLDGAGGEVVVDPTAGYPGLKQWQRKARWTADRLDVVPDYLHRCVVVRTSQPCNTWTLKTSVAGK